MASTASAPRLVCPHCGAFEDYRKASAVFEQSTQMINGRTSSLGSDGERRRRCDHPERRFDLRSGRVARDSPTRASAPAGFQPFRLGDVLSHRELLWRQQLQPPAARDVRRGAATCAESAARLDLVCEHLGHRGRRALGRSAAVRTHKWRRHTAARMRYAALLEQWHRDCAQWDRLWYCGRYGQTSYA